MRSEKVDTRALLNGDPGDANLTNPTVRMEELRKVWEYWPDDVLIPVRDGFVDPPPWRLLLDPVSWHDVSAVEVHNWVREYVARHGRWPLIDSLRRRFGRVSNHRGADEIPSQPSLL